MVLAFEWCAVTHGYGSKNIYHVQNRLECNMF